MAQARPPAVRTPSYPSRVRGWRNRDPGPAVGDPSALGRTPRRRHARQVNHVLRAIEGKVLPHAHCRFCDREIVQAPGVGWLNPSPGDDYDLCPASAYGDHEPVDARGDLRTFSGHHL
ncbi:MAG: hypothetical protein JWR42_573 [Marmoricola sp.]|nr:hypothetical protein [Marmoricola sp.]